MFTSQRLFEIYNKSKEIDFDDSSRFIFFSDCHRGDNSWTDNFSVNQNLFLYALNHYYNQGFTYVEIGDGDELWENRYFSDIVRAHTDVFKLLQKFYSEGRFYMLAGNHDIIKTNKRFVERKLYRYFDRHDEAYKPLFDGINVHEGLILRYSVTGDRIWIIHGHQGDLLNDRLWRMARFLVRFLWRPLELTGIKNPTSPAINRRIQSDTEKRMINWTKANKHMIIAGHTHRPVFPGSGGPLYFNDGSCIRPYRITGIEIQDGDISLIKWSVKTGDGGMLYLNRDILAGPEKLLSFFKCNNT